jgi:hypothetical protein
LLRRLPGGFALADQAVHAALIALRMADEPFLRSKARVLLLPIRDLNPVCLEVDIAVKNDFS